MGRRMTDFGRSTQTGRRQSSHSTRSSDSAASQSRHDSDESLGSASGRSQTATPQSSPETQYFPAISIVNRDEAGYHPTYSSDHNSTGRLEMLRRGAISYPGCAMPNAEHRLFGPLSQSDQGERSGMFLPWSLLDPARIQHTKRLLASMRSGRGRWRILDLFSDSDSDNSDTSSGGASTPGSSASSCQCKLSCKKCRQKCHNGGGFHGCPCRSYDSDEATEYDSGDEFDGSDDSDDDGGAPLEGHDAEHRDGRD